MRACAVVATLLLLAWSAAAAPERETGAGAAPNAAAENDRPVLDGYLDNRRVLAQQVASQLEALLAEQEIGPLDPRIPEIVAKLPRHAFVPEPLAPYAYLNRPLPIGHGQTVSQPFIVALMSQLAAIEPGNRVLLVGMGGGYHAAMLAELGAQVHCVELYEPVARDALKRLHGLGYGEVAVRVGDGYFGWRDAAPYDAVVVRQAVHHIPPPLLAQLRTGGRLVMPVGPPDLGQDLVLATKESGGVRERRVLPVLFTTLPGGSRI